METVTLTLTISFRANKDSFEPGYDQTPEGMATYYTVALADGDMTLTDLVDEYPNATVAAEENKIV